MAPKKRGRGRPGQPAGRFGRDLANHRRKAGLTQAEAAKVLCISENTLGRWERGEGKPGKLTRAAALTLLQRGSLALPGS